MRARDDRNSQFHGASLPPPLKRERRPSKGAVPKLIPNHCGAEYNTQTPLAQARATRCRPVRLSGGTPPDLSSIGVIESLCTMKKIIADISKNWRETVRVELDEYNDVQLVSARVWFAGENNELKPTRKGLSVAVKHLPALAAAFADAEREARAAGLLAGGSKGAQRARRYRQRKRERVTNNERVNHADNPGRRDAAPDPERDARVTVRHGEREGAPVAPLFEGDLFKHNAG